MGVLYPVANGLSGANVGKYKCFPVAVHSPSGLINPDNLADAD